MKIPNSIRDNSIIRIAIQIDGSFNDTLELTGAQLKKLSKLLGGSPEAPFTAKLVAGDAAAEKRENTPAVVIERRGEEATPAPQTVSTPQPETTTGQAPKTGTPEATPAAPATPALPDVTPDLGD